MEKEGKHTHSTGTIPKIVIIGPESTGKSTLSEKLSVHYNTFWCPEYAREYLLTYGMEYDYGDLLEIAKGQLKLEDEWINRLQQEINDTGLHPKPLFIDTNMYVMKVWSEFVFETCHPWILERIVERSYDMYLLCNTDLPWVKDELREYPDLATRERLYHIYRDILINQQIPWVEISGLEEERVQQAISAVNQLLH